MTALTVIGFMIGCMLVGDWIGQLVRLTIRNRRPSKATEEEKERGRTMALEAKARSGDVVREKEAGEW